MPSFSVLNTYQKANFIVQYVTILVNVFGIAGNILLVCALSRRSLRKNSFSFFSIAKALVDTVVLVYAFRNWARFNYDTNLDTVNSFFCVIFNRFVIYVCFFMGILFLPLISLDRLVTIVYPYRFQMIKKPLFQWLTVLAVFVYSVLFNIILPMNTKLTSSANGTVLACTLVFSEFTKHSWMQVANIVGFTLLVNMSINLKLIWHIVSSRRRVESKTASTATSSKLRTSRRDRRFAITSVGLCLMAFVFKLPTAIVIIVTNSWNLNMDIFAFLFAASIFVFDVDCGSAFYVNYALNPVFAREVRAMVGVGPCEPTSSIDGKSNSMAKPSRHQETFQL